MLESVERFARIILTIILGAFVSVAGLNVQWKKLGIETDEICFDQAAAVSQALLVRQETIPKSLVERYAKRCEITLVEASVELMETKAVLDRSNVAEAMIGSRGLTLVTDENVVLGDADLLVRVPQNENTSANWSDFASKTGYVALGRDNPVDYSQLNFDQLDGSPAIGVGFAPKVGDRVKARWEVNLRSNTELTTSGLNAVVGVIARNDCVKVKEAPVLLRSQYWALVEMSAC